MRGIGFVLLALSLFGCGGPKETKLAAGKRERTETVVPMADGSAYVVTYRVEGEEGNFERVDEPSTLWYVTGTKRTKVPVQFKYPSFTPLADGAALMEDDERLFRLEGDKATPVTEDGVPKVAGETIEEGFWFTRWVTDKEGLTDGDRELHLQELEEEGAAEQEPPENV